MSKAKKEKAKKNDDFLAQEAAEERAAENEYTLDIPDDEIWTYQIEGLQAPHINKPFKNAARNKTIVIIAILISIALSIYFSARVVHNDLYKYKELEDGTYELVKFTNTGSIKDITIDYVVVDMKTGEKDYTKPVTVIHEYAFNCDEVINSITFGKDIRSIDGKSIYSCWWIQNVFVDDENPYYCDINGVLYTKDVTEVVFYPNDHDKSLRYDLGYNVPVLTVDKNGKLLDEKNIRENTTVDDYLKIDEKNCPLKDKDGNYIQADMIKENTLFEDDGSIMEELWGTTKKYDEAYFQNYNKEIRTYVIPSTVTKIGELAFAYSNIVDLYIPEGVKVMDNMAIFKNSVLVNIYSYKTEKGVTDTTYKGIDDMTEIYSSLPEGLEFIGSDCMYYTRGLSYMYIPSSVTTIKHHAFWDALYKDGSSGELVGITSINVAAADEETFSASCETGDQWRPMYDYKLFKKSVDINYGAQRESRYNYNVHRQYYWYVQWMINNLSEQVVEKSGYLVKDMDGDGTAELVIRRYDADAKETSDSIFTFNYGYIDSYTGEADYEADVFSALKDNAQLDTILK